MTSLPAQQNGLEHAADSSEKSPWRWELGPTGSKASLRGLSAPTDNDIWLCGSAATILRSADGGTSWIDCSPAGFDDLEFRSIHAWSDSQACVASAGTPAVILLTSDGGSTWREVFRHSSEKAFFDGLKFWDRNRGVAFSDPIDQHLLVLETEDGGETWQELLTSQLVKTLPGEAGFAASNSSMAIGSGGRIWIGTGGAQSKTSRVHVRRAWGERWEAYQVPIPSGAAQGIFSIVAPDSGLMIAAGGDYRLGEPSPVTIATSADEGRHWSVAESPPQKFRSTAIRCQPRRSGNLDSRAVWIASGPTGTDFSWDGSRWYPLSEQGFHVLAATDGQVFAAGSEGRFARLELR